MKRRMILDGNSKCGEMTRPTTVHNSYCKECPSKFGKRDPESKDIANYPDGIKQRFVFPCAWRPDALCKGVCDILEYKESIHGELIGVGIWPPNQNQNRIIDE